MVIPPPLRTAETAAPGLLCIATWSAAQGRRICAGPASRPSHCTAAVQKTLRGMRSSSWWIVDSSARWQPSRCAATEVGGRVTTTTTSCRCPRFPLHGIVQVRGPPQEMVGKCINKTKNNKEKPVRPAVRPCVGRFGTRQGPSPSRGFRTDLGRF